MPPRLFDVNLKSAQFPFLSSDINRTVLLADIPDPTPITSNVVRPAAIFLRNVLPCLEGYDSMDKVLGFQPIATNQSFDTVYPFYDADNKLHFFGSNEDQIFEASDGITEWNPGPTGFSFETEWTKAYLFGLTWFFGAGGPGLYVFDAAMGAYTKGTFIGIDETKILGICVGVNYFIAFDKDRVYYTTDVDTNTYTLNFTPVLGTSGSTKILALRSNISCVLPITNGFIIYGLKNAISAQFSGNPGEPFNYNEILGSSGVQNQRQVASEGNNAIHYAFTLAGFQQLSLTGAKDIFPEASDFIGKKTLETLVVNIGQFVKTVYDGILAVRLNILEERFLTISYGPTLITSLVIQSYNDLDPHTYNDYAALSYNSFTEAVNFPQTYKQCLIYDIDLQRWGKIVEDHVQVFSYSFASIPYYVSYNDLSATPYNDLAARSYASLINQIIPKLGYGIGLLQKNGQILVMNRSNMDDGTTNADSDIVLGRIQFYKVGGSTVNEVEVESFQGNCYIYNSYTDNPRLTDSYQNGKDITNGIDPGFARRYGSRLSGKNQSIALSGKFHLTTTTAKVTKCGNR